MDRHVKLGFETDTLEIEISAILPTRVLAPNAKSSPKYAAIAASVKEVGVIEPPVVYPIKGGARSLSMK